MAKIIFLILLINISNANIFKKNCLFCHNNKDLRKFMAYYTIKYSSEKKIKKAIFKFLKNPSSNKSAMPYNYIIRYGYKEPTKLSNQDLKKAIDIYYKKFNLKNFIK